MATRSTIKITGPAGIVTLYRHWDGYPAGAGRHIAALTRGLIGGTVDNLAARFLAETYEQRSWETAPGSVYERTTSEEAHGDTEWRYRIWLFEGSSPGFQVLARRPGGEWRPAVGGCAAAFRRFVAGDIRRVRSRIRAMKAA